MATISIPLTTVGGTPPYAFSVVPDSQTTFSPTPTISGSNLVVDPTSALPGIYTVHLRTSDSSYPTNPGVDTIITLNLVNSSVFSILNDSVAYPLTDIGVPLTMALTSNGGVSPIVWSLISSVTTRPGLVLSGSSLTFTISEVGSWVVGLEATDSLGNVASKIIEVSLVTGSAYILAGGQFELLVDVPNIKVGTHQFTITVEDSASVTASKPFYYDVYPEISDIRISEADFDNYWGTGDTTSIAYPILGNLSGFQLGPVTPIVASNGLTATVDTVNQVVVVSGPPSAFRNSEIRIPIILLNGTQTVAVVSREFTLLSHSGTTEIGTVAAYTRPYIVGDFVAFNPQRAYFNSPDVFKALGLTVRVKAGSALPPGLSLDQNTGLVYGTLVDTYGSSTSILEYIDTGGALQGSITVHWDTQKNSFTLNSALPSGGTQQPYTGTITSTSPSNLSTATLYRGALPAGLALSVSGTQAILSGTPTEAGYFDVWIKTTNLDGNSAYLYQRLVMAYSTPLVILTSSLPPIVVNQAYSQVMQGYGGISPYTWTSDIATSFPVIAPYITLNSATGVLSGTVTDTGLNGQNANVTFTLTDSNGTVTTALLNLRVDNTLRVTTTALPAVIAGQSYSFSMSAVGGVPPYTWALPGGFVLPSGISFSSLGVFSGVTAATSYSESLTITVTDSVAANASGTFTLSLGTVTGMLIDTSGVGTIDRGAPYQGLLRVYGTFTPSVSWQVPPDSPNPLPSGLTLVPTPSNSGTTATITGSYTGQLVNYSIKVIATDSTGATAQASLLLNTTSSLAITTTSIPVGTVGVGFSLQMAAKGYNTPWVWSITAPPVGFPYTISSSGLLTGTPAAAGTWSVTIQVVDSLSPADVASTLFTVQTQNTTLAISTTSPLPSVTSGVAYSTTLAATGGTSPYTWSVVSGQLPAGLSLEPSTGIISGTTAQSGFNSSITFQVQDSIGARVQKALTLQVASGLTLHTGIDFVNSLSTSYLGYAATGSVDTITPRVNKSFYVVATGVIATSAGQLSVGLSGSGFTSVIESVTGGVAIIRLSGPFSSGAVGDNTLNISLTDVGGVVASASFKWKVYANGALRLAPSVGSIPSYGIPLLETTAGSLPLYNDPSASTFTFQQYNAQPVDKAAAVKADFSLSGDNSNHQGRVSFVYDSTNFLLSYNGAIFDPHVALTNLILSDKDIAWFNSATSSFDLFAFTSQGGGKSLAYPALYMVKPAVTSVTPNPLTIPQTNTSTMTDGPNLPTTATSLPNGMLAYDSNGNPYYRLLGWTNANNIALNNGTYAEVTVYGSTHAGGSNNTSQPLVATNFGFSVPSNATNICATVTSRQIQLGGTSACYSNSIGDPNRAGVYLVGAPGATNNLGPPTATGDWAHSTTLTYGSTTNPNIWGAALTPTVVNSPSFGASLAVQCTQAPGSGAHVGVYALTITLTYQVPNYSQIVVTLDRPFSPQQQGTSGSTGNTVSANAAMTNGVVINSVTPNRDGSGWLTGWTVAAQFPAGTSNVTSDLSMTVGGQLTYLSGTTITSGNVAYINGKIATILGQRSISTTATLSPYSLLADATFSFVTGTTYNMWGAVFCSANHQISMVAQVRTPGGITQSLGNATLISTTPATVNGVAGYINSFSYTFNYTSVQGGTTGFYIGYTAQDTTTMVTCSKFTDSLYYSMNPIGGM